MEDRSRVDVCVPVISELAVTVLVTSRVPNVRVLVCVGEEVLERDRSCVAVSVSVSLVVLVNAIVCRLSVSVSVCD